MVEMLLGDQRIPPVSPFSLEVVIPPLWQQHPPPPLPSLCYAEAVYNSPLNPEHGDLVLQFGNMIEVLWRDNSEKWWRGWLHRVIGNFSKSIVRLKMDNSASD